MIAAMASEVWNLCLCGDEIEPARWALGYKKCLTCGEEAARVANTRLAQCVAPAYNKGAYQPVMSVEDAKLIGRK